MLLSVPLIICWSPPGIWVTGYPRYTLPLCPVWAQSRRKASLHPILLVCDLPVLRAQCEWGRREQCERSSCELQIAPKLCQEIPRKTVPLYCKHQGYGKHTLWPLPTFLPATGSGPVQEKSLEPCRKRATLWEPLPYIFLWIFFCLGRSNTMGVIAASSQFLR